MEGVVEELPEGWELFDRKTKKVDGETYFFNRYINKKLKSGIIYLSGTSKKTGEKAYIVEGYGIGTIDPKTFKEIASAAPIARFEESTEEEAEKKLIELMKEYNELGYR